jgi:fumarate reductase flavoprotein subunit
MRCYLKKCSMFALLFLFLLPFVSSGWAETRTMTADVAVVGCGSAGLAAAVTAAEGGATVIALEKMPIAGGSSNLAEGMFAAESVLQKKEFIDVTKDEAFKRHMANTQWQANAPLIRKIIDKSPTTIDWLMGMGVEFKPAALYPGGGMTWHLIKPDYDGAPVVKALLERGKKLGVQVLFETPGKKLILDDKKRVRGVIAQDSKGNTIRINAKAVVLATGGFANNAEMVRKYTGYGPDDLISLVPLNKTGDGISMAMEAGAAVEGMRGMMVWSGLVGPGVKPFGHLFAVTVQPYLQVNQNGERFCDEAIVYLFPEAGNIILKQKKKVAYVIIDEATKKHLIEDGVDNGMGMVVAVSTKLTDFEKELQDALKANNPGVIVADSIEELAGKMGKIGVDPTRLKKTIAEYNGYCDKGHDDGFAKNPRYLRPVKQAHFYALKINPLLLITLGGVKTTASTEALDTNDEVIPGLYAVGNDVGGLHPQDVYDAETTGGTFGCAVNSGRIAGDNILKYVKQ